MLLAIDVGNTQTHVGMFSDDELVHHWRFATARFATADEVATVLASLLGLRDLKLADVHAAIVSSVVPTLAHEYELMIERYFDGRGALVGPELKTGMPIRIDRPQELGADRLVNAIAAYERVGGACIAVDFGTAINYDVVSSQGEYLGGVISPGIEISLEALSARAARLPRVDIEKPRHAIGKGTQEAIQSGVVFGFAGQVDAIVGAAARGARRGGNRDRDGRLRRRDRPVLRAGRRGGRPAHAPGAEADLGAQQRLTLSMPQVPVYGGTAFRVSPVPPKPFQVSLEDHGRVVVVRVQGEVDTATAPRMGQVVDSQLATERQVVLDLSSVDFMDLHGLAVIMRAARRERTRFKVARPAACVLRLLALIHADGEVPILPDGTDPLEAA